MYAAVIFDLDNTLIDRDAAFRESVQAAFRPSDAVIDELVELDRGGRGSRAPLFDKWRELGGGKLIAENFGVLIARYLRVEERLLRALCELAERTRLAIISNGGISSQEAKWRAAGLQAIVPRDRFFISEAVGVSKPDPAIFEFACNSLNVEPRNCLYVGDRPDVDIAGAKAAGMSALLATSPLSPARIPRLCPSLPAWNANHESH